MATSEIKLYYASSSNLWELLPHKLFVVDNIEDYLATKSLTTISSFQYIKPQLEIAITVDLSQTFAEPLNTSYKYVRIENSDQTGQYYYYFVKNVIWRSKSSVRFELVMDVLNTFKENTHYKFKDNTRIIREHKDRFIKKPSNVLVITDLELNSYDGNVEATTCLLVDEDNNTVCVGTATDVDQYGFTFTIADGYNPEEIKAELEYLIEQGGAIKIMASISDYNEYMIDNGKVNYAGSVYYRNIDYVNENINPLLQCGNANGTKIENNKTLLRGDWYLLYRNQNNPDPDNLVNPVDCFLIPSSNKAVSIGVITSGQINANSLEFGKLYYIPLHVVGSNNANLDAEAYNQTITLSNGTTLGTSTDVNDFTYLVVGKSSEGKLEICYNNIQYDAGNDLFILSGQVIYGDLDYIVINQSPTYYADSSTAGLDPYTIFETLLSISNRKTFTFNSTGKQINKIELLDRADPKNIKLIKLPYCPYDFTITSSKIDVANSDWNYTELSQSNGITINCLKLTDLNTKFNSSITLTLNTQEPLHDLKMTFTPALTDARQGSDYESKLFNSEFYRPTYVYDSFSYVVQMEKLNINSYLNNTYLKINFDMTKTINSRFMFTFDSLTFKYATESYAKCLTIARNNEEVLYNVPYINYVKTGLNYDVKAKNLSNASNWIGAGLSIAGVGLSLALPSAPLKALGVATSLISMAMTTKNAITSTIQNEESLQRKLTEAKNQTASISSSDDVDLMSVYAENRLKYLVYEPNPTMKNMLYNLFFFAGYNTNRLGIPNHATRVNFDYLEADVVLEKIANIPDDCMQELINAFKNGVSYIHKTTRATKKWDFAQEFENWENSIL